ncbi:MAG: flagellar protein FlbB [Pseudomonadota bacterium]
MTWFTHVQIFVVLLFFAALAFGLRSRELFQDFTQTENVQSAEFQEPLVNDLVFPDPAARRFARIEPAAAEESAEAESMESAETENSEQESELGDPPAADDTVWRDYVDSEIEYSGVRAELFEDLSERRKDIEGKERELAMREALLQAAERELEQKFAELEGLRQEIESLLEKQSEEEEARIQSLVRIYEGMKAKDAARIFNTLETDVLLSVIGRMSERKSAPIIASMSPERARSITILLAEQKTLPDLSAQ